MAARSKARKRALDLLYAAEMRGQDAEQVLQAHTGTRDTEPGEYTLGLVRGVGEHRERIDALITRYSQGWTLSRMPAVDRNALRLGIYEVLWDDGVPDAVAVSETLKLVRELSTDDSPAFVNGLLGAVVRDKSRLLETPGAAET